MDITLPQIMVSYDQVQTLAHSAVKDLKRDFPKNFKQGKSMQMGQVLPYLFPEQVSDIIEANGFIREAELIREFFLKTDLADLSGIVGVVDNAWTVDRIMKNIFKNKTTEFNWA